MNEYNIKIGVNYKLCPIEINHTNRIAMISHFQINGIYVLQYFNTNINNKKNFNSILGDIKEFVHYLKTHWYDYDWVWCETWEGYNLNNENRLILDIFNIAFNHLNLPHNKLWFYIGNHLQESLYGFNYVRAWPSLASPIPHYNSNIDCKIEKKIYIQGGRTTYFRTMLYDKLISNKLLDSNYINHTLTLNNPTEGGGKVIPWNDLYKLIDSTFLYVICETDYNTGPKFNRDYVHFTEKTLIPLNQHKPFLMLGVPYYLKYLKKLGFKTCEKFWDESYDDEIDNETRMNMVIELIKDFNTKSISELEQLKNDIKPILLHNKNQYTYLNNNPLIYV
jgi:hypothetical protein